MKSFFFLIAASSIFFLCYSYDGVSNEIIEYCPDAALLLKKGHELCKQEQFKAAQLSFIHALETQPTDLNTLFGIATALLSVGLIDDALRGYKKVLQLNPHAIQALYNTGYALKTAGRIDEAIAAYQAVLKMNKEYDPVHIALAYAYIMKGEFQDGWNIHERYLKNAHKFAPELRSFIGERSLKGKKILLRPEGGLGDTLHFIRYAQRLKNEGALIYAVIQKPLVQLLSLCPYIDKLIPIGASCPPFDASATLMSLPAAFNDSLDTIPSSIPYIWPDESLVAYWKEKIASDTNFKIGICWQCDVHNDTSRLPIARRGIPLVEFFILNRIPGVSFYSLQKIEGIEQLQHAPQDFPLFVFDDFDESHGNFMDSAALIVNLDLIISIDTAIPHLAGALGKPVWLLLPYATDWRWLEGWKTSPWYPTMRIFKQSIPFDWQSVMHEVFCTLQTIIVK